MRTYDVKCPICGKVNRNLYLEETEGWMECDQCRNATKVQLTNEYKLMPVCVVKRIKLHTAVASGRWCGVQWPQCGLSGHHESAH